MRLFPPCLKGCLNTITVVGVSHLYRQPSFDVIIYSISPHRRDGKPAEFHKSVFTSSDRRRAGCYHSAHIGFEPCLKAVKASRHLVQNIVTKGIPPNPKRVVKESGH